ncbi:hypothetical protein [Luteolibacter marinus]|uniref:hypothetical protein n=1 Tax=Luteolibacter marinus TaxID=2776705 RepID=UPI0018668CFF|nr:hypothetical protein [Luteolibacter marinus]
MNRGLLTLLAAISGYAIGSQIPGNAAAPTHPTAAPTKTSLRPERPRGSGLSRMEQLTAMAAKLTRSEWPAFFEARLHSARDARLAAQLWAEADPAGFWGWLRESRDRDQLERFAEDLLTVWTRLDPQAAMDAVMGITDSALGDRLRAGVIDAALEQDTAQGLAFAARGGDFNGISTGLTSWITRDPALATRGLAALPTNCDYRSYLKYALSFWAEQDPAACLAWLKETPPRRDQHGRSEWATKGFKTLAFSDVTDALDAALSVSDPDHRSQALAGVIASGLIPPDEAARLLAQVNRIETTQMAWEIGGYDHSGKGNFENRAGIINLLPVNGNSHNGYRNLASEWSNANPAAAWDWATTIPDPFMSRVAMIAMVDKVEVNQLDRIADLPFRALSNDLLRAAMSRIPVDQRGEWIDRMPDDRAAWARRIAADE